jgi:hypothetical protein
MYERQGQAGTRSGFSFFTAVTNRSRGDMFEILIITLARNNGILEIILKLFLFGILGFGCTHYSILPLFQYS